MKVVRSLINTLVSAALSGQEETSGGRCLLFAVFRCWDVNVYWSLLCLSHPDRHHGTPMLLEGVRCVGVELEYDSEQSDWQGFD